MEGKTKSLLELNKRHLYSHNSVYENYSGQTVDLASWIKRTHPDDLVFTLRLFKATIRLLALLPKNRVKDFNLVYKHRLRNEKGGYDCYILSFIACEVNSEKSCVEIATLFFNSPTTIYKHFSNINRKMGLSTTRQSCAYAHRIGLLQTLVLLCSLYIDDIAMLI